MPEGLTGPSRSPGDLSPEEFRRQAHLVVDWIADYQAGLRQRPVLSRARPGELVAALPASAPARGEALGEILSDLDRLVLPGITHWGHPGFFAYFTSSGSAAGALGEFLTAGLNVNAMLWRTSPAATELELVVCRWLAQLLGLPPDWDGHINDTASSSTLVALAAAREALGLDVRELGLAGRAELAGLRVYASDQAHSSVEKAAVTLGLGRRGYRSLPSDRDYRLDPAALRQALDQDLAAGLTPMAVVATVGTTASTSIDPLPEVAAICRERRLWLHVDAAHGGAMAVVPEYRGVLEGAGLADSLVFNPHKWLFTPLDCSVLYVARPDLLRRAFSLVPEYLSTPERERETGLGARNLMDFGVSLGRRMRALKLWLVLRSYGGEGLAERVRAHVGMARWLERELGRTPGWELLAPVPMATVCFRHHPQGMDDEAELERHNRQLMAAVNQEGGSFISHAVLGGRFALRASIGGIRTQPGDVEGLWRQLGTAAGERA